MHHDLQGADGGTADDANAADAHRQTQATVPTMLKLLCVISSAE